MTNPYDDFEKEIDELIPKERVETGTLGFTVKDLYAVVVPEDTSLFRVVVDDGTFQEIPHKGNCSPTPELRVEIKFDRFDKPYIAGPEQHNTSASNPNTSGQYYVPQHSHARGSGMEFPVDLRLVNQFYVELQGGMTVYVRPGFYYYAQTLKYWAGGTINFSAYVPTQSSTYKWVGLAFNPVTEQLVIVDGPVLNFLVESIGPEKIVDLSFLTQGYIPICAVQLKKGMTAVVDEQIVSLFDMLPSNVVQSSPLYLYQDTTDQLSGTGAWNGIVWDSAYDPLSYLTFGITNDLFSLLAGQWLLEDLNANYVQAAGNDGNLAFRLFNQTQTTVIHSSGVVGVDSNTDHNAFSPTVVPTIFSSNGSDLFQFQIQATSFEFRRAFPTILKLKKL